jgi:D-alanyl-D-alanine carboxypeptidase
VIDAALAGGTAPGISAAIVLSDRQVIAVTAGVSNRETGAPMTSLDRMLIGSVGKTFAAARAVQLIEDDRLGLDDPIEKYLGPEPWFARLPNARAITVRHLMTHTSGLVRYEFKEAFARDLRANPDKTWEPHELLAYVFDEPAPFAPGEGWEYSDTNYIVLGMILERVHDHPYYLQVRRGLLGKMRRHRFLPSTSRELPGLIQGYTGAGDPLTGEAGPVIVDGRLIVSPQFEWTGGGFAGTPTGLARWAHLLYAGAAFQKPESLRLMIDAAVPAKLGPGTKYGLGVVVRAGTPVGEVWGHSGFFPGYLTEMIYLPERGIAIAVQVNTSDARALGTSPLRIAYALAGIPGI